ncbi:MAG: TIGR02172 family protein, partial [Fibrobacter sp.]|nr:TIGR02172 family protein [Fibrobacter sp.]
MNYKQINLNDWELQGEGAFGESYFSKTDSSIMLKLMKPEGRKEDIIAEFENSKKIASVGFKTPAAIELVEESQSGRLGIIYEKVQEKISFTRMIHDNPSDLPRIAKIHAEEAKKFHGINCDLTQFLCYKETIRKAIPKLFTFKKYKEILKAAIELVPDSHGCLQYDFQPSNIVHSNKTGENYWIDMGDFGYGHYLFDIAFLYMFTNILCTKKSVQQIFHMTEQ